MRIEINKEDDRNSFIGIEVVETEYGVEVVTSVRIKIVYVTTFTRFLTSIGVGSYTVTGSDGYQWISFVLPFGWTIRV